MTTLRRLKFHMRPGRMMIGAVAAGLLFGVVAIVGLTITESHAQASIRKEAQGNEEYTPPPGNFTPGPMWLTVIAPAGGSVISTNVPGINCPGTCSASFTYGTTVTLSATSTSSHTFAGWSGPCTGSGACSIPLVDNYSTFVTANYDVNLVVVVHGPGTVTSNVGGISCGTVCTAIYTSGTNVILTASADSGKIFYTWSGACPPATGNNPCSLSMDGPKMVDVWFGDNVAWQSLTVYLPSNNSPSPGTVTSLPDGINCNNSNFFGYLGCFYIFPRGTVVTLTAHPNANSFLVDWEGDGTVCNPPTSTCTVTLDGNRSVGARYSPQATLNLIVHKDPSFGNGGTATVDMVPGVPCTTDINDRTCTYKLNIAVPTNVTMTAVPDPGSTLHWENSCHGSGSTCTLTFTEGGVLNVDLYFLPHLVLNVHGAGLGSATISPTGNPATTTCVAEGTCIMAYLERGNVVLTANPANGGVAWGWGGDGGCTVSANNYTCTVMMTPGLNSTIDLNFYSSAGAMKKALTGTSTTTTNTNTSTPTKNSGPVY